MGRWREYLAFRIVCAGMFLSLAALVSYLLLRAERHSGGTKPPELAKESPKPGDARITYESVKDADLVTKVSALEQMDDGEAGLFLGDASPQVRRHAVYALYRAGRRDAIARAASDRDPGVRAFAAECRRKLK